MIRKSFFLLFFLWMATAWPRPPQLTPRDVKTKVEEILKAHVCYKALTPELMERTLQNFLEELDPSKTYFVEEEITEWQKPNEAMLQRALSGFKTGNFSLFNEIHSIFLNAIERRNAIEEEIAKCELPKG